MAFHLGTAEPNSWDELVAELTFEKPGTTRRLGFSYIFRGVSDSLHTLVPSLGRHKSYLELDKAKRDLLEERVLEEFRYRFASEIHGKSYDAWDLLALAQHVGVPTRLLDWSTSPLVALFFALSSNSETDRAVYCATLSRDNPSNEVSNLERESTSPFAVAGVRRFSPPLSFPRLRNQRGVFTVQPDPTVELPLTRGKKIVIRHKLVSKFRAILFQYGIDLAYIYPDEEGIGKQVRWHLDSRTGLGSHWKT